MGKKIMFLVLGNIELRQKHQPDGAFVCPYSGLVFALALG